jgi:hypothetical protein
MRTALALMILLAAATATNARDYPWCVYGGGLGDSATAHTKPGSNAWHPHLAGGIRIAMSTGASGSSAPHLHQTAASGDAEMFLVSGDQLMRVVAILILALLLTGCEGDRIKHGSMDERQAQPQGTVLT